MGNIWYPNSNHHPSCPGNLSRTTALLPCSNFGRKCVWGSLFTDIRYHNPFECRSRCRSPYSCFNPNDLLTHSCWVQPNWIFDYWHYKRKLNTCTWNIYSYHDFIHYYYASAFQCTSGKKLILLNIIKQTILDYKKERCYIGHSRLFCNASFLFCNSLYFFSFFFFQYPIHLKISQDLFLQSSSSDYS